MARRLVLRAPFLIMREMSKSVFCQALWAVGFIFTLNVCYVLSESGRRKVTHLGLIELREAFVRTSSSYLSHVP